MLVKNLYKILCFYLLVLCFSNWIFGQDLKILGTGAACGQDNLGTIFKFDVEEGLIDTLFNFRNKTPGGFAISQKMIEGNNGNLYGVTSQGGYSGLGVIYEYNPFAKQYKLLHDFRGEDGDTPVSHLAQASNGKLYGVTLRGGEHDRGVLFEYDIISGVYVKLLDFKQSIGKSPSGGLLEAETLQLFGLTDSGGENNKGVLFKYSIENDSIEILHHFNGNNGDDPTGSLTMIGTKLYGVTYEGGQENLGTIFMYDLDNDEFSKLMDFNGANGEYPTEAPIVGANGNLYGTTYRGGPLEDYGIIYEFDPISSQYSIRHEFIGVNGYRPSGHILLATNNKIYGLTRSGGSENDGVL